MNGVSLDYVVNLVKIDRESYGSGDIARILNYAILGYRSLRISTEMRVKVVELMPNHIYTAELPKDYSKYTKVGVYVGGTIVNLSHNKDIIDDSRILTGKASRDECGDSLFDSDSESQVEANCGCEGSYYIGHYRNGEYVGEQYGYGVSDRGGFRINADSGTITFSHSLGKRKAIMEYVSNGIDDDGSTIIPIEAVDTIRNYVHWQLSRFDKKAGISKERELWGDYRASLYEYRDKKFAITLNDFANSLVSNYNNRVR